MSQTITEIIGYSSDPDLAEKLHHLQHQGAVEFITLEKEDTKRRRLRAKSDHHNEYLIALPREVELSDGAIIILNDDRACVIRMAEENWLLLQPRDIPTALELGYFVGNLHWRVKFKGLQICIAIEGPMQNYLDRLQPFIDNGSIESVHGN